MQYSFDFIDDEIIKQKLKSALDFSAVLYKRTLPNAGVSDENDEENCRIAIVYASSIIEAVLHYFYRKVKTTERFIYKTENKHICGLSNKITYDGKGDLFLAHKTDVEKTSDGEITMLDLTDYFVKYNGMNKGTAKRIMSVSGIRNTLHILKARSASCSQSDVEEAYDLLNHTLSRGPGSLAGSH